MGIGFTPSLP